MKSILFVCTGNTCRSVMADVLFQNMVDKEGLHDMAVFSRGIAAMAGAPASLGTLEALQEIGLDASTHRAGKIMLSDLRQADLILVMEQIHRQVILNMDPQVAGKTFLLKTYADGKEAEIADPIGGTLEEYVRTRNDIQDSLLAIYSKLKNQKG